MAHRTLNRRGDHSPRPARSMTVEHREIVAAYRKAGWSTSGFAAAVAEVTGVTLPSGTWLIPDAFGVSDRQVIVHEVVVSHDISKQAEGRYRQLFAWLRDAGWTLRIVVVDRRGRTTELDAETMEIPMEDLQAAVACLDSPPQNGAGR